MSTIESFYAANSELYASHEITKDTFAHCWQAVYYIHMPKLKGTVSPKLVDTIRFYRQHKVSGLQLVANYCQYNKHRTQLKDAFNPWVEFEQSIKGRVNTTEGVSIAESAFNMVGDIRSEKPNDVIRAALYSFPALFGRRSDLSVRSKYDGRFECSFFLRQFELLARNATQVLIVNPGPYFLLAWAQKAKKYACKCYVAVPNIYVAAAYRIEFKNLQFCIFSDIANYAKRFELIAIVRVSVALYVMAPHSHLHSQRCVFRFPLDPYLSERPMTVSFPIFCPSRFLYRLHPQLTVVPRLRLEPITMRSFPQSHRHTHLRCPVAVDSA